MNRIKLLREELHMTQEELATELNLSKGIISLYENEVRKPSIEVLINLSELFKCNIDYILGKSDIRNPEKPNDDPFGLRQLGFNIEDYAPPTDRQKEQLAELMKVILKENKKENKDK